MRLAKQDAHQIRGRLATFLPFLRRNVTVHPLSAAVGSASGGVGWIGTASGKAPPNGPVEEQVRLLWDELDSVREDLSKLRSDTHTRDKEIERTVAALDQKIRQQHQDLLMLFRESEQQQTEFNARALPLIGFGIVLTAVADWLAQWPWVNLIVVAVVVLLSVRVLAPIAVRGWRRRQDQRRAA